MIFKNVIDEVLMFQLYLLRLPLFIFSTWGNKSF